MFTKSFKINRDRLYKVITKSSFSITLLFFEILIWVLIPGCCDPCSGTGSGDNIANGSIYFTAAPLNSDTRSIFKIEPDGREFNEVLPNSIIYSPPSANGLILFMRGSQTADDTLFIRNLKNGEEFNLEEGVLEDISYPVLANSGQKVAFVKGGTELSFIDEPMQAVINERRVTDNLLRESLPVFSPDGNWLAYVEERYWNPELRLTFYNTVSKQSEYHRLLGKTKKDLSGELTLDWSEDSREVVFSITTDSTSVIHIYDFRDDKDRTFRVDKLGAFQPDIAPLQYNRVAFTSRDGEIWIMKPDTNNPELKKLTTKEDDDELNERPHWSPKERMILYHNVLPLEEGEFKARLKVINLDENFNFLNSILLSNKVFKGFWKRKN